jgi:hypothetical protein
LADRLHIRERVRIEQLEEPREVLRIALVGSCGQQQIVIARIAEELA